MRDTDWVVVVGVEKAQIRPCAQDLRPTYDYVISSHALVEKLYIVLTGACCWVYFDGRAVVGRVAFPFDDKH